MQLGILLLKGDIAAATGASRGPIYLHHLYLTQLYEMKYGHIMPKMTRDAEHIALVAMVRASQLSASSPPLLYATYSLYGIDKG
jgi:hypothetical protein